MKKIKVQARLGRYMNSSTLYLKIEDRASGIEFLDLEFDAEQLANLIDKSIAYMEGEARSLNNVGKKLVREKITVDLPPDIRPYDSDRIKAFLGDFRTTFEYLNPGWFLDVYTGSQSSFTKNDNGETVANLTKYTYVEEVEK
jgi:hypothetical protein